MRDNGSTPLHSIQEFFVSSVRRPLLKLAAFTAAALLLVTGCVAEPEVAATGETTEVTVTVQGMRFIPDVIDVPVGNKLEITLQNTGDVVHDLVLDNGTGSDHLAPGAETVIDVGVIGSDLDGWCSVSDHRAMGMLLTVRAIE